MNTNWNTLWQKDKNRVLSVGPSSLSRTRILNAVIGRYNKKEGSLLDVGCGDGGFLFFISRFHQFRELVGVDISRVAINLARKRFPSFTFSTIDIEKETLQRKFDIISSMATLETIADDQTVIGNMAKMLSDGGYVIIAVSHRMKYWTKLDEKRNFRRYEMRDLIEKFQSVGLEKREIFSWGWPVYTLYYTILLRASRYNLDGTTVSKGHPFFSSFLSKVFYFLFFIDDLFVSAGRGRWLFAVFQKPFFSPHERK